YGRGGGECGTGGAGRRSGGGERGVDLLEEVPEVVRVTGGDQRPAAGAVADHRLVDPAAARVADVRGERGVGRQPLAVHVGRLDQEPRAVTDRRDGAAGAGEGAD